MQFSALEREKSEKNFPSLTRELLTSLKYSMKQLPIDARKGGMQDIIPPPHSGLYEIECECECEWTTMAWLTVCAQEISVETNLLAPLDT